MPDLLSAAELLIRSLVAAAETTAFVSMLPIDGTPAAPENPLLVSIRFHAPAPGAIELVAGQAFGALLAANIAADTPDDPSAATDALRELLNITCGDYVARLAGDEAPALDVALPQVRAFDLASEWAGFLASGAAVFDADGHTIAVRLLS